MDSNEASLTAALQAQIANAIDRNNGHIGFDQFMQLALYAPGLGYYSNNRSKIGTMPATAQKAGSDFVTAPQMSSIFGKTISRQIKQALEVTNTRFIYEFGAGTGVLAQDILQTIGDAIDTYFIVDLSGSLRALQQERLSIFGTKVQWLDSLPDTLEGVLLGNEVLDAMPVKLLHRVNDEWFERGVGLAKAASSRDNHTDALLHWQDVPTTLRPPMDIEGGHDYLTEIHPQADAFIRTVGERLLRGAALWIDYGFGEAEYYHPERSSGTLVCHHQHKVDHNPLEKLGEKDITSHVNFTGIAVAAQEAGLEVLGYTTQGRFLINCGIAEWLDQASLQQRVMAAKLVQEHEMGELFKVMLLGKGEFWDAIGFRQGDRTHTL